MGCTRRIRVPLALIVVLLGTVVAGCSGSENPGSAPPATSPATTSPATATPSPSPSSSSSSESDGGGPTAGEPVPTDEQLGEFLAACEAKSDVWRTGRVTYPATLTVPLNEGRTYQARIDVRTGATDQPSPSSGTTAAQVAVQCGVAARLVALSDDVTVDSTDWSLQVFDQPGTVEWDWTVSATKPHDTQVRLELRPAIKASDGTTVVPAADSSRAVSAAYTTDVHVDAKKLDRFYDWWSHNWPKIVSIAGGIGVALGAVSLWLVARRKEWKGAADKPPARKTTSRAKPRKKTTASTGKR